MNLAGGARLPLRCTNGEYHLLVTPVVVGGGTSVFPDGVRAGLDLVDQRRFDSGVAYLRYRARN
jgi:dihydrofolate reductase